MFGGEKKRVQIRFVNKLLDTAVERFGKGKDTFYYQDGEEHFIVATDVEVSDQFFAWVCGFGKKASKNYSFHEINEKTFINGTAICIRFKTDSVDSFEDVRSRIILDGQSEAAKVKRAIKKASYSSGGLIELLK